MITSNGTLHGHRIPLEGDALVVGRREHSLRDGWTNPEIARHLEVTERTVKAHCQELFDRLGTHNRTAVVTAMQAGLLDPAPTDA